MRFRYSLRIGLIVITLLGCWLAYTVHQARIRRDALEAMTDVTGFVYPVTTDAPDWLVKWCGPEYFCRIEQVHGLYGKLSDEHLATFARLPELKSVHTNHAWMGSTIGSFSLTSNLGNGSPLVSDAGLAHLSRASHLESLVLFNTSVSNDGIASLTRLGELQQLMISSKRITDGSIAHLSQLHSLRHFWTTGTSITPAGIERLQKALPNCTIH